MDFRILMNVEKISIEAAAKILNASDQYVHDLVSIGQLDAHEGRLSLVQVQNFKSNIDDERSKSLKELSSDAQSMQMGY